LMSRDNGGMYTVEKTFQKECQIFHDSLRMNGLEQNCKFVY